MAISRAQMRTQLKGGTMKCNTKKMKAGGMLAMMSPAAALALSMKSGRAEGILGMGALGALINAGRKKGGAGGTDSPVNSSAARVPTTAKMKSGGKVRGDGVCQRGRTKGKMR